MRIVLVEDDAATREALASLLELEGHVVHSAGDGAGGVALILRERPDVSLIDLGLPVHDGLTVAQLVRADPEGAGLRLVALTGNDRAQDRDRTRLAGFDAHAAKPIDVATLLRLVAG